MQLDAKGRRTELTENELIRLIMSARGLKPAINTAAHDLEAQGWEVWLKTIAPETFSAPFSDAHRQFWSHYWNLLMRMKNGETIPAADRNILLPLGRGCAKSSSAEMAAIMEGCILGTGYCLYLSGTQSLAEDHLYAVKLILDSDVMERYYPQMAKPKLQKGGQQAKYTQDTIVTECGWAMTARGITGSVRGGRVGLNRFSLVITDDVDALTDSLAVTAKKERILARTVYPAMNRTGISIFAQNLITPHSLASRILSRQSDLLSERTVIGDGKHPVPAFRQLDLVSRTDENGVPRWEIRSCVPQWDYFNVEDARSFLARSGKDAFLAEYQHEFVSKKGKVLSQHDRDLQAITWSEFKSLYGTGYIPEHWKAACGLDVGFSDGQVPHYSAWVFIATAAQNSPLAGAQFIYRTHSFKGVSVDEQAMNIVDYLRPFDERRESLSSLDGTGRDPRPYNEIDFITHWQISHEASGSLLTFQQKYGIPFSKQKHFGATDGIAQWNHLCLPDYTKPHPFRDDTYNEEDGQYELGCPRLFYIVDDDQRAVPRNDQGLKLFFEQIEGWEWVPVELTASGMTREKPSKVNDDFADCTKSLLQWFASAPITQLTPMEKIMADMPERFKEAEVIEAAQRGNNVVSDDTDIMAQAKYMYLQREFAKQQRDSAPAAGVAGVFGRRGIDSTLGARGRR